MELHSVNSLMNQITSFKMQRKQEEGPPILVKLNGGQQSSSYRKADFVMVSGSYTYGKDTLLWNLPGETDLTILEPDCIP
jgi:hypothetical protein